MIVAGLSVSVSQRSEIFAVVRRILQQPSQQIACRLELFCIRRLAGSFIGKLSAQRRVRIFRAWSSTEIACGCNFIRQ